MPIGIGRIFRRLGYACFSHVNVARSGKAEMYLWTDWQRKAKCTVNCLPYIQLYHQTVV